MTADVNSTSWHLSCCPTEAKEALNKRSINLAVDLVIVTNTYSQIKFISTARTQHVIHSIMLKFV